MGRRIFGIIGTHFHEAAGTGHHARFYEADKCSARVRSPGHCGRQASQRSLYCDHIPHALRAARQNRLVCVEVLIGFVVHVLDESQPTVGVLMRTFLCLAARGTVRPSCYEGSVTKPPLKPAYVRDKSRKYSNWGLRDCLIYVACEKQPPVFPRKLSSFNYDNR